MVEQVDLYTTFGYLDFKMFNVIFVHHLCRSKNTDLVVDFFSGRYGLVQSSSATPILKKTYPIPV